jgi:uncharacterized protein (DUF2249 family)
MTTTVITLDARDDFRAGNHPCDKIHGALGRVRNGETLRLIVPFEPVPLYEVARRLGLRCQPNPLPGGDWEILFSRPDAGEASEPQPPASACGCGCAATETASAAAIEVDARGLEPPQPMVKILEALLALPPQWVLRARTDRRPMHLYPLLEARGFTAHTEEQADGSFLTHIRRA